MDLKKVLFVCRDINGRNDGGSMVVKRNLRFFTSLDVDIDIVYIPKVSGWCHFFNMIMRRSYGDTYALRKILNEKKDYDYDLVFFDSSLYGKYVCDFAISGFVTYCFFHNIEYNYYRDKFRLSHSIVDRMLLWYVKYNEHFSAKYAKRCIVMNQRDAEELKRIYSRNADLIFPTSFPENIVLANSLVVSPYILFVGSDFFANVEGFIWFLRNVAPYLIMKVMVVGSICNVLRIKAKNILQDNIILRGFVDNLDEVYANATCVISPIFSGSGLKTKTVEALMYGKSIYGTIEAFVGIDADYKRLGGMCNTAEEFISALNSINLSQKNYINNYSLEIFHLNFSDNMVFKKLCQLINIE